MPTCQVRSTGPKLFQKLQISYSSPGAMVLARSLRDNGTKKQLAIMVTLDTLRASTINELQVKSLFCTFHRKVD